MRPSFVSAIGLVSGVCAVAGIIGVLVGLVTEWSVISGAFGSGQALDLAVEVALVLAVVALLAGIIRRPGTR